MLAVYEDFIYSAYSQAYQALQANKIITNGIIKVEYNISFTA